MNSKSKNYLAAIALILTQSGTSLMAESTDTGGCSSKIREAILVGLPQFDGQIHRTPLERPHPSEDPPLAVDPEVVVLPVFSTSDSRGTRKIDWSDTLVKPDSNKLVAGTGVSEFTYKKYKMSVPRILFIPIGFKFSW